MVRLIMGDNGAGKTTTLRAVAGILDFTEGEIVIDGHSVKDEPVAAKQVTAQARPSSSSSWFMPPWPRRAAALSASSPART